METKHQLIQKMGELFAMLYWHERGTFLLNNADSIEKEYQELLEQFKNDQFTDETNERGNIIERSFESESDRYKYDFELCKAKDGWIQYDTDQDAWYFGIWVNPDKRVILTYAEGDLTRCTCPTEDSYHAELKSMADCYGDPPPAFKVIDSDGTLTHYYDKRPV